MATKTYEGYLVLADISGYTSFLSQSELEHAHEILTELRELITQQFKPVLTVSKLEGDAVFAYAPAETITRREILLEIIESAYIAFRGRIQLHYGEFALHVVAGLKELVSNDVNLVHRLLKNHMTEATGWLGYALFTERCRVFLTAEEADLVLTQDFPADRVGLDERSAQAKPLGWRCHVDCHSTTEGPHRVGARNHCAHGKGTIVETITDWRPFEHLSTETKGSGMVILETLKLEPLNDGTATRIHDHLKMQLPLPRFLRRMMIRFIMLTMNNYDKILT